MNKSLMCNNFLDAFFQSPSFGKSYNLLRRSIALILVFLNMTALHAQHILTECSTCRFRPSRDTAVDRTVKSRRGSCEPPIICLACEKKNIEEKEAREAEDRIEFEEKRKKVADEKRKMDEARNNEIEKSNTQRKSSYVTIENSNSENSSGVKNQASFKSDSKYMEYAMYRSFYDSTNKKIISSPDWNSAETIDAISDFLKVDLNLYQYGLVGFKANQVKSTETGSNTYYPNIDLVDYTGKRVFNNKYLSSIHYLSGGWFMLSIDSSDLLYKNDFKDKLYNIFTKQTIPLVRNWNWGRILSYKTMVDADDYTASKHFMALYDTTKYGMLKQHKALIIKKMKLWLLKYHSDVFSEKMLLENELVLFVTAGVIDHYIYEEDFLKYRNRQSFGAPGNKYYYGGYHGLIIVSKNGDVKKIDL